MTLSSEEVEHLFKLSRIASSTNDINRLKNKLSNAITLADQIKRINCENIEPMYSVSCITSSLREDEVMQVNSTESLFKNLPEREKMFSLQHVYYRIKK